MDELLNTGRRLDLYDESQYIFVILELMPILYLSLSLSLSLTLHLLSIYLTFYLCRKVHSIGDAYPAAGMQFISCVAQRMLNFAEIKVTKPENFKALFSYSHICIVNHMSEVK